MTAKDYRRQWERFLRRTFGRKWHGVDVSSLLGKLRPMRFSRGQMKTSCSAYQYAQKHFPTLLRKFEEEINQ